jgi:hypothetical protein
MVAALVRLSNESMELAYSNREPSLFALAKLLETSLANLTRYQLYWRQVSTHLIQASQHVNLKIRDWGSEALTTLVKSAFLKAQNPSTNSTQESLLSEDQVALQVTQFLEPLQALCRVQLPDIRQRQLDACLHMLQACGDTMQHGWAQLLDIVGNLGDVPNENLVRLAFQCLHLIVSDLLSQLPANCLALVIQTATKFAAQTYELNVSLTAIGLLWNAADHLHQNQIQIKQQLSEDPSSNASNESFAPLPTDDRLPAYEGLWMCLFSCLGDLCTDPRPAIRKSASQTLFHTLSIHTVSLDERIWPEILWKGSYANQLRLNFTCLTLVLCIRNRISTVLFPLLDRVQHLSTTASNDKIEDVSKSMGLTGKIERTRKFPVSKH